MEQSSINRVLVVVGILIAQDNQIIVEKHRSNPKFTHTWQFPGGKVESNETLKTALARELREELGIVVSLNDLVPFSFIEYEDGSSGPSYKATTVFYYICKKWGGEILNKENQEIKKIDFQELAKLEVIPFNKPTIELLLKLKNIL